MACISIPISPGVSRSARSIVLHPLGLSDYCTGSGERATTGCSFEDRQTNTAGALLEVSISAVACTAVRVFSVSVQASVGI